MRTLRPLAAALAVIVVGLAARAGLDKVLALGRGPAIVAQWAQLQSVVELITGAVLAGVGQGLTVLVAQHGAADARAALLRLALRHAFAVALALVVLLVLAAPWLGRWLALADAWPLALPVGVLALLPGLLSAYWLGLHRQDRVLWLALLGLLPAAGIAFAAWRGGGLAVLLGVQVGWLLLLSGALLIFLQRRPLPAAEAAVARTLSAALQRYVPVGLTVGLLGPAALLWVRSTVSAHLSWADAGVMQAWWRSTEWVTATASGVLSLLFLPRLSAAFGGAGFRRELARAGLLVWLPTGLLLALLFAHQRGVLATLYDPRFVLSDRTALWFMLGDWLRVGAWVLYFGLLAARRTLAVCVGDVLSLPLYAGLLWLAAPGLTLERAGLLYCVTYAVYAGFNAAALAWRPSR